MGTPETDIMMIPILVAFTIIAACVTWYITNH